MSPYEARLQRRIAKAKASESYYTRRRHMLARVEKALAGAEVRPQVPITVVGEVVRVTFYKRSTPRAPGYQWTVDVPFGLSISEIVRLIKVRVMLENAKGTPSHVAS